MELTYRSFRPRTQITFRIDGGDRIVHVNSGWDESAHGSGAVELSAPTIIGRSIWDFIHGDEVKIVYQSLLKAVRGTKKALSFPYRCDAAQFKQHFVLTLTPYVQDDMVQFLSRLQSTELLNTYGPICFDFTSQAGRPRCSVCNRLQYGTQWMEPDQAVLLGFELLSAKPIKAISTICGDCHTRLMNKAKAILEN